MGRFKPTKSQQEAISETLGCDVSVSAGAGSGKTEVLVQRFCLLVEQNLADVDEILTVTFTEKAANEMKERILRHFMTLAQSDTTGRFKNLATQLQTAYIGTIHSFASRVLRENAFEAGVGPNFQMLTEAETIVLKDEVLEELIAAKSARHDEGYLYLSETVGEGQLRQSVLNMHSHFSSLGKPVTDAINLHTEATAPIEETASRYFALMDEIARVAKEAIFSDSLLRAVNEFLGIYPRIKANIENLVTLQQQLSTEEYVQKFDWHAFEETIGIDTFVKKNLGSKDHKAKYIQPTIQAATELINCIVQPIAKYMIDELVKLTDDFQQRYTSSKREIGSLDFDDLLCISQKLLINSDGKPSPVAQRYREKFEYVIFDEFQDTNAFQKRLVDSVTHPDRLFTVGDVKQSIYSFIHSDVSVFIDHHNNVNNSESGRTISFTENFRSSNDIVSFVNWFFDNIWGNNKHFIFEKLEAMGSFCESGKPAVELILAREEGGILQARMLEAVALAEKINNMLGRDGSTPLQITDDSEAGTKRDLQPGDILILFRSTTAIPIYEKAFVDAGIDYYLFSGGGYYSNAEVSDLLAMLRLVENPLDDVAMAQVLRSPMVAVSDDTLWWLSRVSSPQEWQDEMDELPEESDIPARNRNIGKLYTGLRALSGLHGISDIDREKLQSLLNLLDQLHAQRNKTHAADLLQTIVRESSFDLKLLASFNGRRKYANVRKLLEMAEGLRKRGLVRGADFLKYVKALSEASGREPEAAIQTETSPVVKLMTVHRAKGLQSPVVIVADSARQLNLGGTDIFLLDRDGTVSCKLKPPFSDKWIPNDSYKKMSETAREKSLAEEERLLYVALTRAKEKLIVSGFTRPPTSSSEVTGNWASWIEKALGISAFDQGSCNVSAGDISINIYVPEVEESEAPEKEPDTLLQARLPELIEGSPLNIDLPVESRAFAAEVLESVSNRASAQPVCDPGSTSRFTLSVSRILDYRFCPAKYYLKWVLGNLPEDEEEEMEIPRDGEFYSGATFGSAVHQVLGALDFSSDPEPQLARLCSALDPRLRSRTESCCRNFLSSEWAQRIRRAQVVMQEVPFRALLTGGSVMGRIDLLLQEDGIWSVIDYKTGAMQAREQYIGQVNIYAWALKKCLNMNVGQVALVNLSGAEDLVFDVDDDTLEETTNWLEQAFSNIAEGRYDKTHAQRCEDCDISESAKQKCREYFGGSSIND